MLVNGFDAWLETPQGRVDLTAQRYQGNVVHPNGHRAISGFTTDPWPTWRHAVQDGVEIVTEILSMPPAARTVVRWSLSRPLPGASFTSGRFSQAATITACSTKTRRSTSRPATTADSCAGARTAHVPAILSAANGTWRDEPQWYRNFLYTIERERGLDDTEDLASPGLLTFDLARGAGRVGRRAPALTWTPCRLARRSPPTSMGWSSAERTRRGQFADRLARAADAYIVQRGVGQDDRRRLPVVHRLGPRYVHRASRPVSGDRAARRCARHPARVVEHGVGRDAAEPLSRRRRGARVQRHRRVALVRRQRRANCSTRPRRAPACCHRSIASGCETSIVTVLEGLARGTRYGIRADRDGLLACGAPGVQLTWMDARVGDRVITPRTGKPVEIQALWINALEAGARLSDALGACPARARARPSSERFWDAAIGGLCDVVDVDHVRGTSDAAIRPNQIFAVGGLPHPAADGERARSVVDLVERELLDAGRACAPCRRGSPTTSAATKAGRRCATRGYHQGTAWPWLLGAFVDAWIRVRGGTKPVRDEARARFLTPLWRTWTTRGSATSREIADADPPHTPRGCPFQAWSVGEAIRIDDDEERDAVSSKCSSQLTA